MMYRVYRTSTCFRGTAFSTYDTTDINIASGLCGSYNDFYCCSNCGCFFTVEELPDHFGQAVISPFVTIDSTTKTTFPSTGFFDIVNPEDWTLTLPATYNGIINTNTQTAATAVGSLGVRIDAAGNVTLGGAGGTAGSSGGSDGVTIGGGVAGTGGAGGNAPIASNNDFIIYNNGLNYRVG